MARTTVRRVGVLVSCDGTDIAITEHSNNKCFLSHSIEERQTGQEAKKQSLGSFNGLEDHLLTLLPREALKGSIPDAQMVERPFSM